MAGVFDLPYSARAAIIGVSEEKIRVSIYSGDKMERAILNVCGGILGTIDRERRRLNGLKDALARLTSVVDGLPRGGGYRSRLDALAASVIDAEREIRELNAIVAICQIELSELLDASIADDLQRAVIFRRYGRCLPFTSIASEMTYSPSHVMRLHRQGLDAFTRA